MAQPGGFFYDFSGYSANTGYWRGENLFQLCERAAGVRHYGIAVGGIVGGLGIRLFALAVFAFAEAVALQTGYGFDFKNWFPLFASIFHRMSLFLKSLLF